MFPAPTLAVMLQIAFLQTFLPLDNISSPTFILPSQKLSTSSSWLYIKMVHVFFLLYDMFSWKVFSSKTRGRNVIASAVKTITLLSVPLLPSLLHMKLQICRHPAEHYLCFLYWVLTKRTEKQNFRSLQWKFFKNVVKFIRLMNKHRSLLTTNLFLTFVCTNTNVFRTAISFHSGQTSI